MNEATTPVALCFGKTVGCLVYGGTEVATQGTPVLNLKSSETLPEGIGSSEPRIIGRFQ